MPDALTQAIFVAEPERLRDTLLKVIKDPTTRRLVADDLLLESTTAAPNTASSSRVLHPRYVKCKNCKREIDLSNDDRSGCRWHNGSLRIRHEDPTWTEYESKILLSVKDAIEWDLPGFQWSCCTEAAGDVGCQRGSHVVDEPPIVKRTECGEGRSILWCEGDHIVWENWDAKK